MFLFLLKLICFITILYFFGWNFSRRVLKQSELYLLIPLSMFIGIYSYTFSLNIFAYFIPINFVYYFTLFALLLASLIMFFKQKTNPLVIGMDKKHVIILALISFVSTILFSIIILNNHQHDGYWHYSLPQTIVSGNFPVKSLYLPFNYAQYHYAFDLFSSSFVSVFGLGGIAAVSMNFIVTFVLIYWLVFAFIFKISRNIWVSYLSATLFFFGGGFRYLTIVRDIDWPQINGVGDFIDQLKELFMSVIPLSGGYFHNYSASPYATSLLHPPTFFYYPLAILVFYFMYLEDKYKDLKYKIILGVFLGFLALASEVAFVLMCLSWGIWKILRFKNEKKYIFLTCITVGLIASFIAIFQGGVITDAVIHATHDGTGADKAVSTFVLRDFPGLVSFGKFYPFNELYSYFFMIVEWGLPLILFIASFFVLRGKISRFFKLIYICIIVTLLIAFNFDYPVSSDNLFRLNTFAYILMSFIASLVLFEMYKRKRKFRVITYIFIFLIVLTPGLNNIRFLLAEKGVKDYEIPGNLEIEKNFSKLVDETVPKQAAILSAEPAVVNQLWGRLTYFGTPPHNAIFYRRIDKELPVLLDTVSVDHFVDKGIRYIYVNNHFLELGGRKFIEDNLENLKLVVSMGDDRKVYEMLINE